MIESENFERIVRVSGARDMRKYGFDLLENVPSIDSDTFNSVCNIIHDEWLKLGSNGKSLTDVVNMYYQDSIYKKVSNKIKRNLFNDVYTFMLKTDESLLLQKVPYVKTKEKEMLKKVKGIRSVTSKQNSKKQLPATKQSKQRHFRGKSQVASTKSAKFSSNSKGSLNSKNCVPLPSSVVSFITVGRLTNFGNTCYVNSALQMLRSLSTVWQIHLDKSINDSFVKEFKIMMDHSDDASSHLQSFLHEIRMRNAQFNPGTQQDVHEAIQFILHQLCGVANIIRTYITFQMKTEVRCCRCFNFTHRYEPSIFLNVPLSKIISEPVPLQNCIQQSLISERLTGENAYQCDKCSDKVDATTERTIMGSQK